MSLVARVLEAGGIATVTYTNARDIAASAGNPRQIFLNYPLGNPAGRPHDPDNQREVLRAGFQLLEAADRPGIIVDLPHVWSESTAWIEDFMTAKQPFISEAAEAKRLDLKFKRPPKKLIQLRLDPGDVRYIDRESKRTGIDRAQLVRSWVKEKIAHLAKEARL